MGVALVETYAAVLTDSMGNAHIVQLPDFDDSADVLEQKHQDNVRIQRNKKKVDDAAISVRQAKKDIESLEWSLQRTKNRLIQRQVFYQKMLKMYGKDGTAKPVKVVQPRAKRKAVAKATTDIVEAEKKTKL
jgi:hypothetical protein